MLPQSLDTQLNTAKDLGLLRKADIQFIQKIRAIVGDDFKKIPRGQDYQTEAHPRYQEKSKEREDGVLETDLCLFLPFLDDLEKIRKPASYKK